MIDYLKSLSWVDWLFGVPLVIFVGLMLMTCVAWLVTAPIAALGWLWGSLAVAAGVWGMGALLYILNGITDNNTERDFYRASAQLRKMQDKE